MKPKIIPDEVMPFREMSAKISIAKRVCSFFPGGGDLELDLDLELYDSMRINNARSK